MFLYGSYLKLDHFQVHTNSLPKVNTKACHVSCWHGETLTHLSRDRRCRHELYVILLVDVR